MSTRDNKYFFEQLVSFITSVNTRPINIFSQTPVDNIFEDIASEHAVESTSKPTLTVNEANEGTISAFDQLMNEYSQQEKLVSIPFSYVSLKPRL